MRAARIVMAGQRDICQSAVSASDVAIALTARQVEVLRLAGLGLCGKQIARRLGIPFAPLRTISARCGGAPGRAAKAS